MKIRYSEHEAGKRHTILEQLKEVMSVEGLLDSLVDAMSDDEALENFEHIARMEDIDFMSYEEEEAEEEEEEEEEEGEDEEND